MHSILLISLVLPVALCDPVLFWTNKGEIPKGFQFNSLPKLAENEKLVVFVVPGFDMASFSKAADVYSTSSSGGQMQNLKAAMKAGKDYALLEAKSDPLESIRSRIESDMPVSSVSTFSMDVQDVSGNLIYAYATSYEDLDNLVAIVSKLLASSKYGAMVMADGPAENKIVKRSVSATASGAPGETFVSENNCLLYIKRVSFIVHQPTTKKVESTTFTAEALDSSSQADCTNFNASTFKLVYKSFNSTSTAGSTIASKLTELTIKFNIELMGASSSYWKLPTPAGDHQFGDRSEITIDTKMSGGKVTGITGTSARSRTSFEASTGFSFSCAEPHRFQVNETQVQDGNLKPLSFSVEFFRIQLQPFNLTHGGWTDPDDCMPFFTEGIWMTLITMVILLLIFFFGLCMIASIKTMDRFDDPRQKPMVINVRE